MIQSIKTISIGVAIIASASVAQSAVVARWTFDQVAGNTVLDSMGAFNGTLSLNGAAIVSGGRVGNAVSLTKAANGYVNMGNVLGLTSGDFSLVSWIKMNAGDTTDASIVIGKHASGTRNGYFINVNKSGGLFYDNRVLFHQGGTGVAPMTTAETPISTSSVNDGNWHQIVVVYQAGGTKKIYVDGAPAEDSKPSQAFIGNSVALLIGGQNEGGIPTGKYTGLIDEVQIYNHALTDSDIDFLYQNPSQTALTCEQKASLLATELETAQATISSLESQLQQANNTIQSLQGELLSVDDALQRLTLNFQNTFRKPQFQIPGSTSAEQTEHVVSGILNMNYGQQQTLYFNLGGAK